MNSMSKLLPPVIDSLAFVIVVMTAKMEPLASISVSIESRSSRAIISEHLSLFDSRILTAVMLLSPRKCGGRSIASEYLIDEGPRSTP